MSGKSAVLPHRRADREFVDRTADRFGANTLQNPKVEIVPARARA
jgi:hypothetical protein